MCRKFLIGIILVGYIVAAIQLIRFTFGDTLDKGVLTFVSIFLAGLLVLFLRRILLYPNMFFVSFLSTFFVVFVVALLNYRVTSSEIIPMNFHIAKIGKTYVKHRQYPYVILQNEKHKTKTMLSSKQSDEFKVGEKIVLNTKIGFWGFPILLDNDE